MKPIRTLQTNFTFLHPGGGDPLPCSKTSDGRTISVWAPTDKERQQIAAGENIELHIWMQPPPPVGFNITRATEVPYAPVGPPKPPRPPGPPAVG